MNSTKLRGYMKLPLTEAQKEKYEQLFRATVAEAPEELQKNGMEKSIELFLMAP